MSTVATLDAAAAGTRERAIPAWLGLCHATTIFVSAFLLFQVQPLVSKFILPWFGGSPAVWTTAMLFFQVLLFGGYLYAHLVSNRLAPKEQAILHVVLLVIAAATLRVAPDPSWKPEDAGDPTGRILALLAVTIGLPYFLLSTTGPLVQTWFSRAFVGRSPYRLYSLSNVGSLLALLSYPFVIEPVWNVNTQSRVWSFLFLLFAVLCGIAAAWNAWLVPVASLPRATSATAIATSAEAVPTARRRLLWLVLPALASLMLLATTNHVCQDVAVVPFLWVIPLSLYLLTFIIAFDHSRWYQPLLFGVATLLAVLAVAGIDQLQPLIDFVTAYRYRFGLQLVMYFVMMFLVCMTCHGELIRLRPDPRYLTEFYLMISAGGALGGLFVSLVAPHIFRSFVEWKIALLAAFVLAVFVVFRGWSFGIRHVRARSVLAAVLGLAGISAIVWWQTSSSIPIDEARNFYGVVSVHEYDTDKPEIRNRILYHGAVAHGRQLMAADKRREPISYYYPRSGIGKAIAYLQQRENLHVGTVGLGVGTTAAFARQGDYYRFYEINPEVVRQANEYFTFLKDCPGKTEVILGDARLALEREPSQNFDLLICDAFSGDSIPMHLATHEAFEIYQKHLKPDGILAINITNSYIDIFPMMRAMADRIGMKWTRLYVPRIDRLRYRTDWLLMTNDQKFLDATPIQVPADRWNENRVPIWTDHFCNLWDVLR